MFALVREIGISMACDSLNQSTFKVKVDALIPASKLVSAFRRISQCAIWRGDMGANASHLTLAADAIHLKPSRDSTRINPFVQPSTQMFLH